MQVEKVKNFYRNFILEKAIFFSIIFFIFKFLFPIQENILLTIINEALAIHLLYFWMSYLPDKITVTGKTIFRTYFNVFSQSIILLSSTLLFFHILPDLKTTDFGFLSEFVLLLVSAISITLIIFIYAGLRKLFFYKQRPNAKSYFNVMALFALIIGLLNAFDPYFSSIPSSENGITEIISLQYLLGWKSDFENIFQIALIIIIVVNAFRVSWIATLNKKQKKSLAGISFLLTIILSWLVVMFFDNNTITKTAYLFSPTIFVVSTTVLLYGAIYSGIIFFTALFHIPTAEESDRKSEEYSTLLDFGRMMTRIWEFDELADAILKLAKKISAANAVWLVIRKNGANEFYQLNVNSSKLRDFSEKFLKERKIVKPVVIKKIELSQFIQEKTFDEVFVSPIKTRDKLAGYLFAGFNEAGNADEDLIRTFTGLIDYAALAIENSELLAKSIENERMEKELELAREIQRKIIPQNLPEFPDINITSGFFPAFEVGGDYYDFFDLNGKKIFVIADVSGKGMEASYIMAEMKGVLESLTLVASDLRELIIKANKIFRKRLTSKQFITAIFGEIAEDKQQIKYFRLGHNLPLSVSEDKIEYIKSSGLGLGIADTEKFEENLEEIVVNLTENQKLIFYTDGIPEGKNDDDEEFGYDKFAKVILTNVTKSLDIVMEQITTEISLYSGSTMQTDDITLLIFEKK